MPTVKGKGQVPRAGYQDRSDIESTHRADLPHDDLRGAFAGNENKGVSSKAKKNIQHSTNVKSRKTQNSKAKTPVR